MANGSGQRFRVFDAVEVADRPAGTPGRMVVQEVRRYGDDAYRYGVGNVDSMDDEWNGLYAEDLLTSTGEHVDVSLWDMPGPFDYRDVVVVSGSVEDPDLRGQTGVVEGPCEAHEDDPETIGVWFFEIARFDVVESKHLVAKGRKAPRPTPGEQRTSTMVGADGSVLGTEEYVVVDDLKCYLGQ